MSVLEDYLRTFEGCLIVVSHDRYFMDKMVDHLFVFEGQGVIKDIFGNYTEFRKKTNDVQRIEKNSKINILKLEEKLNVEIQQPSLNSSSEKKKLSFKEKMEFDQLEQLLVQLEQEKNRLTEVLSNTQSTSQEIIEAGKKLSEVVNDIENKTERWLILSEFI